MRRFQSALSGQRSWFRVSVSADLCPELRAASLHLQFGINKQRDGCEQPSSEPHGEPPSLDPAAQQPH